MNDIINKIQEHNANRKLQILKGFVEVEDVLEKGHMDFDSSNTPKGKSNLTKKTITDKNGHQTTKWVKQGEDVKDEKKPKEETANSNVEEQHQKFIDDIPDDEKHEQLQNFIEKNSGADDEETKQLVTSAKNWLKENPESDNTDQSMEDNKKSKEEKISHEQHMLLSEAMGDGSDYEDSDDFVEQLKNGEVIVGSDDFEDLSDETIKNWFDENLAAKQENDLHNKLSKVDKSVEDLKKHLTPKKE